MPDSCDLALLLVAKGTHMQEMKGLGHKGFISTPLT